jgi:threonine 3-dehydrogenase
MITVLKTEKAPGAIIGDVAIPTFGAKDVLIKVKAAAICGTDLHIYDWDPWASARITPPRIFGHEMAGEIIEVGKDIVDYRVGDYVSCESHIVCYNCQQCQSGLFNLCRNTKIIGVHVDGVFAEYVALPAYCLWKTGDGIPPEIAAIQDPLGNALHATLIDDVAGKSVAVFGCGPVGLGAIAIARISGAAEILAIEPNTFRRRLASKLGASYSISPKELAVVDTVLEYTDGEGVDVVLEMSGHPEAIKQGLKVLKRGGRVSLMGLPLGGVSLDITEDVIVKGARIFGVSGRKIFGTWLTLNALLVSGRLNIEALITHRYPLQNFESGIKLMESGNCGKVILYP